MSPVFPSEFPSSARTGRALLDNEPAQWCQGQSGERRIGAGVYAIVDTIDWRVDHCRGHYTRGGRHPPPASRPGAQARTAAIVSSFAASWPSSEPPLRIFATRKEPTMAQTDEQRGPTASWWSN